MAKIEGYPPDIGTCIPRVVINEKSEAAAVGENKFPDIDFNVNRIAWRSAALTGDELTWDNFDDERDFKNSTSNSRVGVGGGCCFIELLMSREAIWKRRYRIHG